MAVGLSGSVTVFLFYYENGPNVTEKRKGGRTPTASRRASSHETKADVSIMTETGVRRFS
jgi:hypothetical protein